MWPENGTLILLDGATNVVHVVDKSQALIGWAVKKGAEKLLRIVPRRETPSGRIMLPEMPFADFEVLVNDAKGAHKEHLDDAADLGKQAHAYIEAQIKFEMGRITHDASHAEGRPCPVLYSGRVRMDGSSSRNLACNRT